MFLQTNNCVLFMNISRGKFSEGKSSKMYLFHKKLEVRSHRYLYCDVVKIQRNYFVVSVVIALSNCKNYKIPLFCILHFDIPFVFHIIHWKETFRLTGFFFPLFRILIVSTKGKISFCVITCNTLDDGKNEEHV